MDRMRLDVIASALAIPVKSFGSHGIIMIVIMDVEADTKDKTPPCTQNTNQRSMEVEAKMRSNEIV